MKTLYILRLVLTAMAVVAPDLRAQNSQALSVLIAQSDSVVVATHAGTTGMDWRSAAYHIPENFKEVGGLVGERVPPTLQIEFVRGLLDPVHPLKPGQRLILFLKHRRALFADWQLADQNLGCQIYTHDLEAAVRAAVSK